MTMSDKKAVYVRPSTSESLLSWTGLTDTKPPVQSEDRLLTMVLKYCPSLTKKSLTFNL